MEEAEPWMFMSTHLFHQKEAVARAQGCVHSPTGPVKHRDTRWASEGWGILSGYLSNLHN